MKKGFRDFPEAFFIFISCVWRMLLVGSLLEVVVRQPSCLAS